MNAQSAPIARVARPSLWRSIIMFLSIIGPGIITANADNDVGGILTYSQAGAQFGYSLLWLLIPVAVAMIVVQEMCARMGAVTGKGLADLIRENFGVKITFGAFFFSCSATSGTRRRSSRAWHLRRRYSEATCKFQMPKRSKSQWWRAQRFSFFSP